MQKFFIIPMRTCSGKAVIGAFLALSLLSALPANAERFGPALGAGGGTPILQNRFQQSEQRLPARGEKQFTLGTAVRHAIEYNPTLAATEAQARSSEEGRKSDLGQFGPKLSMTYTYSKYKREASPSTTNPPSAGTYGWSVEVSQILFDGFKTLGTYQKQALQAASDKGQLRNSELSTTATVQENFISYLCAVENVRSQKEACERLRDQLTITRAYHAQGLKPKLDVLQAEVDLSQAEQTLVTNENTRDTVRAKLNTLLGLPATDRVVYKGTLAAPVFTRSLEQCLETASRMRPDLYVGYKAVEMAVKDRLLARAGYYPTVEAYYNISKTGNTPDWQKAGSNSSRSTEWEVGAKLSWDVFQWGTTYFSDQQAGWLVAKARANVRDLALSAGYDVKEKFLALREAARRTATARRSVAAARESYAAALEEYRAQVGTNFDVLNASSKLLTAENDLTAAIGDQMTAVARLYQAMGEYHPDLK